MPLELYWNVGDTLLTIDVQFSVYAIVNGHKFRFMFIVYSQCGGQIVNIRDIK